MDLYKETLKLLADSDAAIPAIAEAIQVSPGWLYKILSGETPEPSVIKIQKLYDWLRVRGRKNG